MRKKFIAILAICVMLTTLMSCEGGLEGFMAAMKQNAAGEDTSAVENAVTNLSKVNGTQKIEEGQTELEMYGQKIPVPEGHTTFLAPITPAEKDVIVTSLASALKNDASKTKLIEELDKPVDEETMEAVRGTAAVAQMQLDAHKEEINNALAGVDPELHAVATNLIEKLETVSTSGDLKVSKADMLTLQIMESFASSVITNLPKQDPSNPNTGSGMPELSPEIIEEANTLLTVVTQINGNSEIFPPNMADMIGGLLK